MGGRNGWVKIPRCILDDPLINKDPEYLALWVHLLCNAAYEPMPALLGGKRITLQPGQLTTGRQQLAANSKIHPSKVERILKELKSGQLIEQQTTNKNRLITIVSGDFGRESEQQNEQPSNNQRTTIEQPANTLEEIKEIKNIRNKEVMADKPPNPTKKKFSPPSLEEVSAYCLELGSDIDPQRFLDYYQANGWVQGRGKPIKDWKAAVRTWGCREQSHDKKPPRRVSWFEIAAEMEKEGIK